jgi:hypothetical protein
MKFLVALDRKIPRAFQTYEEADIQDLSDSPVAELTYKELEPMTVFSEPEDEEYTEVVVERPQLTAKALKKGIHCGWLSQLYFDVDHCMDRCPKFKPEMDAVLVLYKEMYKDVQKRINQSEITSVSLRLPFLPLRHAPLFFRSP